MVLTEVAVEIFESAGCCFGLLEVEGISALHTEYVSGIGDDGVGDCARVEQIKGRRRGRRHEEGWEKRVSDTAGAERT